MPAPTLVIARIWVARHWGRWSCGQISRTRRSAGLHRAIDAERKRNSELVAEKLRLEQELAQAKLELKLERQNKFATNTQKSDDSAKRYSANGHSTSDESTSQSVDDSPVTEPKSCRTVSAKSCHLAAEHHWHQLSKDSGHHRRDARLHVHTGRFDRVSDHTGRSQFNRLYTFRRRQTVRQTRLHIPSSASKRQPL